jgi:hypothetical protein
MTAIVDRAALLFILDVSDSAISAWERAGMPVYERGRGRGRRSRYDLATVHTWMRATGRGLGTQAMLARDRRALAAVSPAKENEALLAGALIAAYQQLVEVYNDDDALAIGELDAALTLLANIADQLHLSVVFPLTQAQLTRFLASLPDELPKSVSTARAQVAAAAAMAVHALSRD